MTHNTQPAVVVAVRHRRKHIDAAGSITQEKRNTCGECTQPTVPTATRLYPTFCTLRAVKGIVVLCPRCLFAPRQRIRAIRAVFEGVFGA